MCRSALYPRLPLLRITMSVLDSNYENSRWFQTIIHDIGKTSHSCCPHVLQYHPVHPWIRLDAVQLFAQLLKEFFA
jgi:hypothetical protein